MVAISHQESKKAQKCQNFEIHSLCKIKEPFCVQRLVVGTDISFAPPDDARLQFLSSLFQILPELFPFAELSFQLKDFVDKHFQRFFEANPYD